MLSMYLIYMKMSTNEMKLIGLKSYKGGCFPLPFHSVGVSFVSIKRKIIRSEWPHIWLKHFSINSQIVYEVRWWHSIDSSVAGANTVDAATIQIWDQIMFNLVSPSLLYRVHTCVHHICHTNYLHYVKRYNNKHHAKCECQNINENRKWNEKKNEK